MRRAAALAGVVAALAACRGPDDGSTDGGRADAGRCRLPFAGDPAAPPEAALGVADLDGRFLPIAERDTLALVRPFQGGHVLFIAVWARNVDPCRIVLRGTLRDPESGALVGEETRPVAYAAIPDGGGWAEPDLTSTGNASNVPACPNYETRTLLGAEFDLAVEVRDTADRVAEARRRVRLECRQTDARAADLCRCECAPGYSLGKCVGTADGGAPDG